MLQPHTLRFRKYFTSKSTLVYTHIDESSHISLTSILISHFMLNLRSVHLIEDPTFDDVAVARPERRGAVSTVLGNLGAPLAFALAPDSHETSDLDLMSIAPDLFSSDPLAIDILPQDSYTTPEVPLRYTTSF